MTTHATKRARRRVVIEWLRCGDFIRLPAAHPMTIVAIQAFVAIVLRVTETDSERASVLTRAPVWPELMARAARPDIAIA